MSCYTTRPPFPGKNLPFLLSISRNEPKRSCNSERVQVTYPCDENAIEAVQQLCGNLAKALDDLTSIANIVTTSKALVTRRDALVPSSVLVTSSDARSP